MAVELLNPNVGISTVLPQVSADHLPSLDNFNTVGNANTASAAESFRASISRNAFEDHVRAAFTPALSSDELLQPAKLNTSLQVAFEKLSQMREDADIRRFVRDDLNQFMENRELLQTYINLVVEG